MHSRSCDTKTLLLFFEWGDKRRKRSLLRCPGIEPGSTAWKAAMLTTIPTSHDDAKDKKIDSNCNFWGLAHVLCSMIWYYLVLDTLNIDWILTFYQINSFFCANSLIIHYFSQFLWPWQSKGKVSCNIS